MDSTTKATNPKGYSDNPQFWHDRCQRTIQEFISENEYAKKILEAIARSGCDITPNFFKCKPCKLKTFASYTPALGLVVCENVALFESELTDSVLHELVHAYDACRAELDPMNCRHIACTEIRAANLSGECKWSREIMRGNVEFLKHEQHCVKRRATLSTKARPHCSERSAQYVESVWRNCYTDTDPFEEPPL